MVSIYTNETMTCIVGETIMPKSSVFNKGGGQLQGTTQRKCSVLTEHGLRESSYPLNHKFE